MERISLNLYVDLKAATNNGEQYYVIGSVPELGSWKEPKLMNRLRERSLSRNESGSNLLSNIG